MKGLFIPGITAEMFRNGCLESIEALMAEGEIYDIEYEPEPQWIPWFKAKELDRDEIVEGFYFAYPETTYCFTEDYERHPVPVKHCLTKWSMTDWSLPNRPIATEIDINTLELIGWVDAKRKYYGTEMWVTKPYQPKEDAE